MRKIIVLSLMLLGVSVQAQGFDDVTKWIKSRSISGGTMLDLNLEIKGIVYTDGLKFGSKGYSYDREGSKLYFELSPGVLLSDERPSLLLLAMFHPVNITEVVYSKWKYRTRVKLMNLPDIAIGPSINLPIPGINQQGWTWKENVGVAFAVKFR